jgi:hypothetical protein
MIQFNISAEKLIKFSLSNNKNRKIEIQSRKKKYKMLKFIKLEKNWESFNKFWNV